MNKYVLVVETISKLTHYPFNSNLDIETIEDEISELNSIAIAEQSSEFSYLSIRLDTIWSAYTNEYYTVLLLENWFEEFCIKA